MRFPSFLSFFLSPTTSFALWLTIHSKHLSGVCIVPKNPLISRFLSRLNFFKKNPCDENVHLNVTPFIPSSVYLWMDGRCKKNREHIDEKLLERYKYDSWDEGTRSLSFSLSIIFTLSFLSRSCFIETDIWNATTFDQARLEIFLTVSFEDIRSTTTTTTVSSVLTDLHVRSCKKSLKETTCELLLEFLLTNAPVSNLLTTQYRPYYSPY